MNVKLLTKSALICALMCVLSQIAVPLPFTAIVLSLGITGMYIAGALLPPRSALFSLLAYLLLGAAGVPVFAKFGSGIGALIGPTGGFLITYPKGAFVISLILKKTGKSFLKYSFAMFIGTIVCHSGGVLWFCIFQKAGLLASALAVSLPFIPFDIFKIMITAMLCGIFERRIRPH
ncbi:MAG: biotin transporter BioY [Ruminococcus sp.]|jgi:biotin transport system substrate-specific component|nr:biotin transporter BioY [Ruminococcus sp.]